MEKGIFDRDEFLEKIIKTLDALTVTGAKNVIILSAVFQMLNTLKKGLNDEYAAKYAVIESLKEQLKNATEPKPEEPGGDVVGGQHFDYHFGGADE